MCAMVLPAMESHITSAAKLRPSPAIPGSMESAIKMWLQVGNVPKLQQAVMDGYGWLLRDQTTRLPHVNKFLRKVPEHQDKIDTIHEQVIRGDTRALQKLFNEGDGKTWSSARDHYGHSPFHKSVMANQEEALRFMIQNYPNQLEERDNEGRTPLHYAAALFGTTGGLNQMYDILISGGADENVVDVQGHSPYYYRDHPQDIRHRTIQSRKPPPTGTRLIRGDPDSATSPSKYPFDFYEDILACRGSRRSSSDHKKADDNDDGSPKIEEKIKKKKLTKKKKKTSLEKDGKPPDDPKPPDNIRAKWKLIAKRARSENVPKETSSEHYPNVSVSHKEIQDFLHKSKAQNSVSDVHKAFELAKKFPPDSQKRRQSSSSSSLTSDEETKPTKISSLQTKVDDSAKRLELINATRNLKSKTNELLKDQSGKKSQSTSLLPLSTIGKREKKTKEFSDADKEFYKDFKFLFVNIPIPKDENPLPPPNRAYLRSLIHNSDIEHLEKVVLDGHGSKLLHESTNIGKVSQFMFTLPDLMDTISILHNATTAGVVSVVSELLSSERLALSRDQHGATPLHKAVLFYQPKIVKLISEKYRLTTRAKDQEGRTPLHYSAALHDSGIFYRYLLKCGADEHIQDKYGKTAKYYVYSPGEIDLNVLVARCKEMPRKREPQERPKMYSLPPGQQHIVDTYLHSNPPKELSTLMIRNWIRTSDFENLEQVVLDGHGSRIIGETASDSKIRAFIRAVPAYMKKIQQLHEGAHCGNLRTIQACLTRRKLAISKDDNGHGLLHKAVFFGYRDIVEWLLDKYPETNEVKDWDGRLPIHYAAANANSMKMYSLLTDVGKVDISVPDFHMRSFQYYAEHPQEIQIPPWEPKPVPSSTLEIEIAQKREMVNSIKRQLSPKRKHSISPARKSTNGVPKINGLEVNSTNIRIWIHEKDIESLEKVVYEGHGHLLLNQSAGNVKVRKFLDSVPKLLNDIREIHEATVKGDLESIVNKEYRPQLYSAKDINGISAFHKAIILRHKDLCEHFLAKTDKNVLEVSDRLGRQAIHYAAAYAREHEDKSLYYWLIDLGVDPNKPDDLMNPAETFLRRDVLPEINLSLCSEIPEAPRIPPTPSKPTRSKLNGSANLRSVISSPSKKKSKKKSSSPPILTSRESENLSSIRQSKAISTKAIPLKKMTKDQIAKWIRFGNLGYLEQCVYAGKGRFMKERTAWNEETRKYLKTVPILMKTIDQFHEFVSSGNFDDADELLAKDPKLAMSRDEKARTVLHKGALNGHLDFIKKLLEEHSEVGRSLDKFSRTPLHYAARHPEESRRNDIWAYLESYGIDKTAIDQYGHVPEFYLDHDFPENVSSEKKRKKKSKDDSNKETEEDEGKEGNEEEEDECEEEDPDNDEDSYKLREDDENIRIANVVHPAIEKPAKITVLRASTNNRILKNGNYEERDENNVKEAIKDKDFDRLVYYVLEGDGDKLMDKTSDDEEVQEFLDSVSTFQEKISKIHKAVENGSLKSLQLHLDRKKFALAKEKRSGISILHKAILLGHTDIVRYLSENFPETLKLEDRLRRTPLHYAAAITDKENSGSASSFFKILVNAGGNIASKDIKNNVPGTYLIKKSELNEALLKKYMRDPEPFLPPPSRSTDNDETKRQRLWVNDDTLWKYLSNISTLEDKEYYKGIFDDDESDQEGIIDLNVPDGNVDLETLAKLDRSFRRLTWARPANSLLKKFLIKPIFDRLKERSTIKYGSNLFDVIKGGIEVLDDDLGVTAPDEEAYKVFAPLIKPIIYIYHKVPVPQRKTAYAKEMTYESKHSSRIQPEMDWKVKDEQFYKNIESIKTSACDPSVLSYRITVSRSIRGYPFHSRMTSEEYITLENDLKTILSNCFFFPEGKYVNLKSLLNEECYKMNEQGASILRNNFLPVFEEENVDYETKFLLASGGTNFWPVGRGVWVAEREITNSLQIRINQGDHLELIRDFLPSEDLHSIVTEIESYLGEISLKMKKFDDKIEFLKSPEYGYLTFSPGDLGTGMRISSVMELPPRKSFKISQLEEIADAYVLRINGKVLLSSSFGSNSIESNYIDVTRIEVSNRRTFGKSESEILLEFFEGLKSVIGMKQSIEEEHVRFSFGPT